VVLLITSGLHLVQVLQDFLSRARTMEHLEEYARMQRFAEAKANDRTLLSKQREARQKVCYMTIFSSPLANTDTNYILYRFL